MTDYSIKQPQNHCLSESSSLAGPNKRNKGNPSQPALIGSWKTQKEKEPGKSSQGCAPEKREGGHGMYSNHSAIGFWLEITCYKIQKFFIMFAFCLASIEVYGSKMVYQYLGLAWIKICLLGMSLGEIGTNRKNELAPYLSEERG